MTVVGRTVQVSLESMVVSVSSQCQQNEINICHLVRILRQTKCALPTLCTFLDVQKVINGGQYNNVE